jgi:integrase
MATLRQRGGRWQAIVRRRGHKALVRTFRTRAMAKEWATRKEDEIDRGTYRDATAAERMIVAELLARYQKEITPRKRSQRTERSQIRMLKVSLGHLTVARLTPERIVEYADARLRDVIGETVRKEINLLSNALRLAQSLWQLKLPENAAATAREILMATQSIRTGTPRVRRVSGRELDKLYRHAPGVLPAMIEFAVETAMRRGELCAMRRVDVSAGLLEIPAAKTGARTIPLSSRARELLRALPTRLDGLVWGLRPDSVSQSFARACLKCGIVGLHFHDLRHEGTSRLFEKGLSIEEVALITGHSEWKSLKRYTHLSPRLVGEKLG